MRIFMTVLIFLALAWCQPSFASCSDADAKQAEEASTSLADWDSVYNAFVRYKGCDDGGVAEGYSDTVGRLLADHWDEVDKLSALVRHHPTFRKFVLRHIDETLSQDQLARIRSAAHTRCPAKDVSLCKEIAKAAE